MADQTIAVEFKASTGAAIQAVTGLSSAITEATTAATVAGSAQEQLGKDIAVTRRAQVEATEAVRAAKQALETLTLTEQAFGKGSREAAQAAEKLAAAEREAQRAAAAAADALAKTATEVEAVARAEDGQLSPATKRAAAQVARMGEAAQKTAADLDKMALQGQAAARATEEKLMRSMERGGEEMVRMHGRTSKISHALEGNAYAAKKGAAGFDLMGFASGKLMAVLGPAALGGTLIALAGWLGEAAQKTLQYETAIANLPFAIDGARAATKGLISEQVLVAAASSASSLKVTKTAADFEILAAASVKLAAKLGQPADQLLGNLVTALGRGSTELLDNAGIVLKTSEAQQRYADSIGKSVGALTEEEKASAFKTEALKAIIKAADETTISYDSNAAALVRMKNAAGDAWDSIERAAVNGAGATVRAIDSAVAAAEPWMAAQIAMAEAQVQQAYFLDNGWSPAFTRGAAAVGEWAANLLICEDALEQVQRVLLDEENLKVFDAANAKEREKRDLLAEETEYSERMAKAIAAAEKSNEAFLDAQATYQAVYGPQEAPKKKKSGKKKEEKEFSSNSGTNAIVRGYDGRDDTETIAGAAVEAAAQGREEKEAELFARRMGRLAQEEEMLDAQQKAEAERVDAVFFTITMEEETEARRAALLAERLSREEAFARWQVRNARTAEAREAALTRVEEAEHRKRLAAITRAQASEAKVLAQRQQIVDGVGKHVVGVGAVMMKATEDTVNGQRGAFARGLADYTKSLAIEMGLRALKEFALAAAAAAMYNYPGAAAHATAGGMALAVAGAAGGASAGFGAAASSAESKQAAEEAAQKKKDERMGKDTAKETKSERPTSTLERMDVPVSFADRTPIAGPTIVIQIGTFVGGKNSEKALAEQVQRVLAENKGQGSRP